MRSNQIRNRAASSSNPYLFRATDRRTHVSSGGDRENIEHFRGLAIQQRKEAESIAIANMTVNFSRAQLAKTDREEFHKAIVYACEHNNMSTSFSDELIDRLAYGGLDTNDLPYLLFKLDNNDSSRRIKEKALNFLKRNPEQVFAVLNHAKKIAKWPEPSFSGRVRGELHSPVHLRLARLDVSGRKYESCEHTASSIKDAERLALIDIFAQIAGIDARET